MTERLIPTIEQFIPTIEQFHQAVTDAMDRGLISTVGLAREFGVSMTAAIGWVNGENAPQMGMRKVVFEFLRKKEK